MDPVEDTDAPVEPTRPAAVPPLDIRDRIGDWVGDLVRRSPGRAVAAVVLVAVVGVGVWYLVASGEPPARLATDDLPRATAPPATTTTAAALVVHVAGAVEEPGVYHLDAGARVADAVVAAGGPVPDAELDRLNLAAPLGDGERIHVPVVGEEIVAPIGPQGPGDEAVVVDLNTAGAAELETLPGIGPTIAAAIVAHRSERPFTAVEELLDVAGIGPTRLEQLRDLVVVR